MAKRLLRTLLSFMVAHASPKPDVDGGLIGGAALKADSFMGIVEAF